MPRLPHENAVLSKIALGLPEAERLKQGQYRLPGSDETWKRNPLRRKPIRRVLEEPPEDLLSWERLALYGNQVFRFVPRGEATAAAGKTKTSMEEWTNAKK